MDQQKAKQQAALKAAEFIHEGMIVGLGSGTTAAYFIQALAQRVKKGLKIQTVASSHASTQLAQKEGIQVLDLNAVSHVDLTVDGADEIDQKKRMIKGGGGAHVREKILAASSREMVVIVDESKCVERLGKAKLPVEILFYGSAATRKKIEDLGYVGSWRFDKEGSLFLTENGNILFDIHFPTLLSHPEDDHAKLIEVPGVIDTGFFFRLAGRVVVGYGDGRPCMVI